MSFHKVFILKKRKCKRFNVPGTTLSYRKRGNFFRSGRYTEDFYPVLNISRGGAKFVCHNRLKVGMEIAVLFDIPSLDNRLEILCTVRWVTRNPEESYSYQVGVSFWAYGRRKSENPPEILDTLKKVEKELVAGAEIA